MEDFKYFEEIEAYTKGSMPEDKRSVFQNKLASDEALKKEYRAYQATLLATDILGFQALKDLPAKQESRIVPLRRWLAVAAGILLLALSGCLLYANLRFSPNQLLSDAFVSPSFELSASANPDLVDAWQAYQQEDYNASLQILSPDRGSEDFSSQSAKTLYAFSLVADQKGDLAIPILEGINPKNDDLNWQLMYAYLQQGDRQKAVEILERLSQNQAGKYAEKAASLQADLTGFWSKWVLAF